MVETGGRPRLRPLLLEVYSLSLLPWQPQLSWVCSSVLRLTSFVGVPQRQGLACEANGHSFWEVRMPEGELKWPRWVSANKDIQVLWWYKWGNNNAFDCSYSLLHLHFFSSPGSLTPVFLRIPEPSCCPLAVYTLPTPSFLLLWLWSSKRLISSKRSILSLPELWNSRYTLDRTSNHGHRCF